ncbi:hypothetical protein SAMN05216464_12812 [Mucilaginibacter pineti]|uniref:Outer membrane protein beta-barrel domain-containing protein n=1 Tax=Mucilaginibacter pineti TaxID=1391627 RepID=A0A1G7NLS8_9SPHI|nr:hypothetical protein [Mucilaginibacter pineti]SDF74922.1 hypothetical protein SAMN05216464_12812 [Mucilaginibacter pineti]
MKLFFTGVFVSLFAAVAFGQKPSVVPAISRAIVGHEKPKTAGKDTVMESDTSKENKEPRYYYASFNTNVFVNTKGGVGDRFSPVLEFGRAYGIFDIGLAAGRLKTAGRDTVAYLEFRPTINVFSKGRFAESLCLGAGYVFGAKQALMTEICNSINFNVSENIQVSVSQGYCFYDGTNSSRTGQYMGLGIAYNFLKGHSVNKQRKKAAIVSDQ